MALLKDSTRREYEPIIGKSADDWNPEELKGKMHKRFPQRFVHKIPKLLNWHREEYKFDIERIEIGFVNNKDFPAIKIVIGENCSGNNRELIDDLFYDLERKYSSQMSDINPKDQKGDNSVKLFDTRGSDSYIIAHNSIYMN